MTIRMRIGVLAAVLALGSMVGQVPAGAASAAFISAIAPASASYGESVTITGTGFGGPNVVVRVGGVPARVTSATGNRATFLVPLGVPVGDTIVTATNPGGHVGSIGFNLSGLVTLHFDEAHRVERTIGPQGGALTAQSAGRTFSLVIPPGALAADDAIVMTPIASLTGLPLDRNLGGVHFAPEGLTFLKPAVLNIDLPDGTDINGNIGYYADGNGGCLKSLTRRDPLWDPA